MTFDAKDRCAVERPVGREMDEGEGFARTDSEVVTFVSLYSYVV